MFFSFVNYCLKKRWISLKQLNTMQLLLGAFLLFYFRAALPTLLYTFTPLVGMFLLLEVAYRVKFAISLVDQLRLQMTLMASRELLEKTKNNTLTILAARWLLMPGLFRQAADFTAGWTIERAESALHWAVVNQRLDLLQVFCEHANEKDICKVDFKGENILHKAVVTQNKSIIEFITTLPAYPTLLNQRSHTGETPFTLATALPNPTAQDVLAVTKPVQAIYMESLRQQKMAHAPYKEEELEHAASLEACLTQYTPRKGSKRMKLKQKQEGGEKPPVVRALFKEEDVPSTSSRKNTQPHQ